MGAGFGRRSQRLGTLGACLLALAIMGLSPAVGSSRTPASTAKTHCQYASVGGPCAPIMSIYNYFGYHEGDLSLIRAKLSPNQIVGHVHKTWPTPGEYEVNERTFTWHSVASVEIVGVYIQRGVGRGFSYKKLPTGKHSGQAKLTAITDGSTPNLVLQGRNITSRESSRVASAATAHCQYYSVGGPCQPIMSVYTFSGYHEGDLSLIRAKLSPTEVVGHVYKTWPTPGYYNTYQRTFTWHAAPRVELVGAYIVHFKGKHATYTTLPSGKHGGHATITDAAGGSSPILVLQGRHTR